MRGPRKAALRLCGERRSKGAKRIFAAGGNKRRGLCDDENAPSFVDPKQLDELNIACTKVEEEE